MAKERKIVTQIEIEALVAQAQKDLADVGSSMEILWKHGEPPKKLAKEYENLKIRLSSLQKIAKKGIVDTTDIAQAQSDYRSLKKDIHNLTIEYELLTDEQKKGLLSPEERKSFEDRRKAIQDYNKVLEKNIELQEKQNRLKGEKENRENRTTALTSTLERIKQKRSEMIAPTMGVEAKEYVENLEKIDELQEKIKATQKTLGDLETKGKKGNADYRRAEDVLKTLQAELTLRKKNELVGKADYDKYAEDLSRYNDKIKIWDEKIAAAEGKVDTLKGEIANFNKELSKLDVKDQAKLFEDLKNKLVAMGVKGAESAKDMSELEAAVRKLEGKALKRVEKEIAVVTNGMKKMGDTADAIHEDMDTAASDIKRQADEAARTKEFEERIKKFLGLAGAAEVLKRSLRNAFETTKELDAAMTEMAVVTDLEVGDYWNQLPEHTKRASNLGVAIKQVYEAETLYYQQGLKTAEAQALANETLKMARIAGLDASEATDKMTAALRGFNMELNEASAQKVADVYSELAAITAADVNEISSAMTKTASIASSAGMEFETTAAFLSQIIETTRESAETAGTAMKTVIARFQELKKSPDEIGEIDGEIVDANAIETALRSVGVSLRDSSGQFRELDDVFLELSSKWSGLDKNTQRYIATIAAGSRQQSRFIAMMSDYGRTQELVTAANNSAGASQKQYEKTLESLETKLAKLKNAWDEFSMGILQSDLVKFGVDALTKFLEIINKATSSFDGLGGTIMKVLTLISMFKIGQKTFEKVKSPIMKFGESLKNNFFNFGKQSGESFVSGTKEGIETATKTESTPTKEETSKKEPKTIKEKFLDSTGISAINSGRKKAYASEQARKNPIELTDKEKETIAEKKAERDKKYKVGWKKDGTESKKNGAEKARKDYEDLTKEIDELENKQETLKKQSEEAWAEVGKGISQAGQAIAGVGVGVSMLGGLFSSLGLEEVGDAFSTLGTWVTFAGTAISGIGALIPVVAKVAVAAGISVQAAWWWLVAIVAVLAAVIVGITAAIKQAQAAKLENRMKAAAEATEKAREAAEGAKQAYDDMVADRKGFDEMQKKLAGLIKGTQEWKEALRESNTQVLDLIATYPDLAKYLTRGEQGQLMINDAGWDKMIADQERAMTNAQAAVAYRQINELDLKKEQSESKVEKTYARYYHTDENGINIADENGYYIYDELDTELKELVDSQSLSYDEVIKKATEVSKKYKDSNGYLLKTEAEIKKIVDSLYQSKEEIKIIADQAENIARANLAAMASEDLINSKFGDEAIDAFANSLNSEEFDKNVQKRVNETLEADSSGGVAGEEQFTTLAKEYGVEDDIVNGEGNDAENTKKLYKAVIGTEAGEGLSVNEMLKEIYAADETNKLKEKMENYADTLASIGDRNVAGLLSNNGDGMTGTFAKEFITDDGKTFDRDAVDTIAKTYFGSIEAWAAMVGKTTEELYDEIEENVRGAIATNEATFGRFKRAIGSTDESLDQFGKNVQISTENSVNLIDKIIGVSQMMTDQEAMELKGSLDTVLDAAGDKADMLAGIVGTMSWNSVEAWKELPEIVKDMGIELDDNGKDALNDFIGKIKELGVTVETVNLKKLTSDIQNMFNTLKALQSGEQGRVFDKDAYDKMVAYDSSRKDQFVQIGEEFHYIGSSMSDLTNALIDSTKYTLALAQVQREQNLKVADAMKQFDDAGGLVYGGKTLKATEGGSTEWARDEQIAYLEAFRANGGMETLQFLTGEDGNSLGITLGTNFQEYSAEQLDAIMKALEKNFAEAPEIRKALAKTIEDAAVAGRMTSSYTDNLKDSRGTGDEALAAARAFGIQAAQSGQVADAVIGRYNDIIAGTAENVKDNELEDLQKIMEEGLERANQNLEAMKTIQETTNRVAEALYNIDQAKIDKLSQLNDSINEANDKLLNKIQEQIDDERQAREQQKTQQNLTDKESRLAYLMMDTSGANDLEIQQLQKELSQERESYSDSLVDQGLENLQQANEQAAEQRERQIELMQAQLDYSKESGALMLEAENIVAESTADLLEGKDPMSTKMAMVFKEEASIGTTLTEAEEAALEAKIGDTLAETADATSALIGKPSSSSTGGIQEAVDLIKQEITKKENAGSKELEDQSTRADAVSRAVTAVKSSAGGWTNTKGGSNNEYEQAKADFVGAGSDPLQFDELVRKGTSKQVVNEDGTTSVDYVRGTGQLNSGVFDSSMASVTDGWHENYKGEWDDDIKIKVGDTEVTGLSVSGIDTKPKNTEGEPWAAWIERASSEEAKAINDMYISAGLSVGDKSLALYRGEPYIYRNGAWRRFNNNPNNGRMESKNSLAEAMKKYLNAYETGGLADFTGPAWLDGTKSHPELVLNARDTENFIQLKDILSDIMRNSNINNSTSNSTNGTNYFTIDINVESLGDDYDVEQLADKIRNMIYQDSTYRNVNAVNFIR